MSLTLLAQTLAYSAPPESVATWPTGFGNSALWDLDSGPWTSPRGEFATATMLAANPGVWARDDFLSGEEVARVLDALPPTNATCPEGLAGSFDATCWGRCKGAAHDKQVCKVCSQLETTKYPWLTDRMLGVWDSGDVREKPDTFDVMRYQKHAEPTLAHRDRMSGGGYASASMVVFLTDGNDAALHFPNTPGSALKIHPKVGSSAAWLNALPCGRSSYEGVHGVEAAPESATGDRIVLFSSTMFPASRFAEARGELRNEARNASRRLEPETETEREQTECP